MSLGPHWTWSLKRIIDVSALSAFADHQPWMRNVVRSTAATPGAKYTPRKDSQSFTWRLGGNVRSWVCLWTVWAATAFHEKISAHDFRQAGPLFDNALERSKVVQKKLPFFNMTETTSILPTLPLWSSIPGPEWLICMDWVHSELFLCWNGTIPKVFTL